MVDSTNIVPPCCASWCGLTKRAFAVGAVLKCTWVFNPKGPPNGATFVAMVRDFGHSATRSSPNHARKPKAKPDTV